MSAETETVKIGGVDYTIVAEQDDGGGDYEWTHVGLVRDPAGHLFLVRDSGCSCNSPWEDMRPGDLAPVASWQDAVNQLKDDMPWSFTDVDVIRFAEKLMALQPAPSTGSAA